MRTQIGAELDRLDGLAKVTGRAKYVGDLDTKGVLRIALVTSAVYGGHVRSIDTSAAAAAPGVVGVMTNMNAPRLEPVDCLRLLHDTTIYYAGQPVALIAADTLAQAERAAQLVRVEYDGTSPIGADFAAAFDTAFTPSQVFGEPASSVRGDPGSALKGPELTRIDATYTTPMHVHSPMEPHTVTVQWQGDHVTVHTATSGIFPARAVIARAFGLPPEHVRVLCPFQGGGFCSKGSAWWPCLLLAVSAAKLYHRAVRLDLTREQMFVGVGNRQRTVQTFTAAADRTGRLVVLHHDIVSETGLLQDYSETTGFPTRIIYACPNVAVRHRLVKTHTPQPVPMRGPGEGPGSFALESALDELAEKLAIDPVDLRLRNWAERDQHADRPWSSNSLRECLRVGAKAFGWEQRGPVRTMQDGNWQVGWGMASSYYPGYRSPAAARVRLNQDHTVVLECGNQEIGTGACTVMAQAVAEQLRAPLQDVRVLSGDTSLPETPMAAGAKSTASVIPAVEAAATALQQKIIALATNDPRSALYRRPAEEIAWISPGEVAAVDGSAHEAISSLFKRAGVTFVQAEGQSGSLPGTHTVNTFGACYAEVRVDLDLGQIRVSRLTAAYAAGRIMNAKLARSQFIGGLVFGIGMALHEKVLIDPRSGFVSNRSLTDYLLPVHADVPSIEVHLVEEDDPHVPSGVKGLGMNGTVGTAAAITNAVYHATGFRVRDLPIFPEALVDRSQAIR
jgi:xanthine dehydrogenase YagR molybdenum-binding subunit